MQHSICILVCLGCYKCKNIYYRVVWGGDKLKAICEDVIIVLHCGLWSGLKCAYEADSVPLSKSRGRESVHINFPRPLHEVERTSKWQQGFPRGEVLREVRE